MRINKENLLRSEVEYIELQKYVTKMHPEVQASYAYKLDALKRKAERDRKEYTKKLEIQHALVIAKRWDKFMNFVVYIILACSVMLGMVFVLSLESIIDILF